jgi:hypothetical protein
VRLIPLTTASFAIAAFSLITSLAHAMSEVPKPPAPTSSAEKVRITFTADSDPAKLAPIRILEGIEIWPA